MSGVTEVSAGAYVLLDARYAPYRASLTPAARVLTTVTSRPQSDTAITDAGQKAVSVDRGLPLVDVSEATVSSLSAEHCRLQLTGVAQEAVHLGDTLWLTPYDIGTCTNVYDYIHAARDGHLEAVWRVAARGQYR
jgi:3-hydroxy-D-aspartate aldolase